MQAKTIPVSLVESHFISPKVKHFVFKLEEMVYFSYIPGQFITFFLDWQGQLLRRSYSIANAPTQDGLIEIAAGFVEGGPGSSILFNLNPGEQVQLAGPYGRLILKPTLCKRTILVATSTGITPYRAMLNALHQQLTQDPSRQIIIMLGVQTSQDVLYRDEFELFTKNHPQVDFRIQLSRAKDDVLGAYEYRGYVQDAFPLLALNPEQDMVYLCGNPSMIDASFAYLKEQGFNSTQVIREKYISN